MKEAAYGCPKEVADAIERLRALLDKHYAANYTFLVSDNSGKVIAVANRPLAGGTLRSRPAGT